MKKINLLPLLLFSIMAQGQTLKERTNALTVDYSTPPTAGEQKLTLAVAFADEKRYALVIGNTDYQFIPKLKNSANDAEDFAAELSRSNFEVIKLLNATKAQMREGILKFQKRLVEGPKDKTVGLFYYAGHGVQHEGENYLVPIEANVKYDDEISGACLGVQKSVLRIMENSNSRMNIVVMDACRNNPFPSAFRSVVQGLTKMEGRGSYIAFATGPGAVASDGSGRNGLYTQELLKAMRSPGKPIEQVFKDVRSSVQRFSGGSQSPWEFSNITGDFYFKFE